MGKTFWILFVWLSNLKNVPSATFLIPNLYYWYSLSTFITYTLPVTSWTAYAILCGIVSIKCWKRSSEMLVHFKKTIPTILHHMQPQLLIVCKMDPTFHIDSKIQLYHINVSAEIKTLETKTAACHSIMTSDINNSLLQKQLHIF